MNKRHPFGLLAVLLGGLAAFVLAQTPGPRIVVGPEMLVSRDGDSPHVELILAANPRNAKNLLGGAITSISPKGGAACRAYATVDGGMSWRASEFAEQIDNKGADPYAAFTPQGTALFSALTFGPDESGNPHAYLHLWRSEDGGLTWGKTQNLGYSYDHEQITVDQTTGRYAGRIYIGVLYGYPVYTVGIFRSEDDGRSWIGPVAAADGGGTKGVNVVQPMVLSDGTLVVPYADFEFLPDKVKFSGKVFSTFFTVLSTDGGVSFGAPRKVQTQQFDFDDKAGKNLSGFPAFAADSRSERYRDRIYVAYPDFRSGRIRILFSRSEDRGLTWSEAVSLDPDVPKDAMQFQPVVAVNRDGVVAVTWYDTRDSKEGSEFHQYFAASLDGGVSFLEPVRVSSVPSTFRGAGNLKLEASSSPFRGGTVLHLVSPASRWPSGGDYMGLAADKDGIFHPFWADARSGTFQIYTAAVTVLPAPSKEPAAGRRPGAKAAEPARTVRDLQGLIELVFDPTSYDAAAKESSIPVRLKNVSKRPIYPPIALEIIGFGFADPDYPDYPASPTTVVNAANGKSGAGARFSFSGALGNLESLAPGALSGPVVMKFRFDDPTQPPPIRLKVEGSVEPDK